MLFGPSFQLKFRLFCNKYIVWHRQAPTFTVEKSAQVCPEAVFLAQLFFERVVSDLDP
jgi:hypothetical protein